MVIFQATLMIFMFQQLLCFLIFAEIVFDPNTDIAEFEGVLIVIFCRFIAAVILHISLMDETARCFVNMKYILNHSYRFERWPIAYSCAVMQLWSVVFVEMICIIVICLQFDPLDITFNFVALAVIADFDEMCFDSVEDCLKKICPFEDEERALLVIQHTTSNACASREKSTVLDEDGNFRPLKVVFKQRSCGMKLAYLYYKAWRMWYVSFYFYFAPYSVVILSVAVPLYLFDGNVDTNLGG